jgi:uncharacterized Zn finger protein
MNPEPRSSRAPGGPSSILRVNLSRPETDATAVGQREWWAQRWVDVLESFGWRRRLERARNYVREGKVLELSFHGSQVIAKVQGTAPEPYDVSLSLDPFTDEQWQYVVEEMSQRAIFAAKLLAGEMPQTIEDAFTASGLSLFPLSKFDIHSRCSCPDPVNPCKHIGAVYYLLGDHFSQDPFILFQLRGRSKETIIAGLRQMRSQGEAISLEVETTVPRPTPLQLDPQLWHYRDQLDSSLVVIAPPPSSETVLDVLGPIPLEPEPGTSTRPSATSVQEVMDYLGQVYQQASQQALVQAMMARESAATDADQ